MRRPAIAAIGLLAGCITAGADELPSAEGAAQGTPRGVAGTGGSLDGAKACGMDASRLLRDELTLRPLADERDLYKLVHQAVLGPGHALADPEAARRDLDRELAGSGKPRAGERIVEDLDELAGTVRVNLRRWRFVRGSSAELWRVLELSARVLGAGDRDRLALCLEDAARALPALGRDASAFRAVVQVQAQAGFPPISHSDAYRGAYAPSYRVVLRRYLPPWVTAPPPTAG